MNCKSLNWLRHVRLLQWKKGYLILFYRVWYSVMQCKEQYPVQPNWIRYTHKKSEWNRLCFDFYCLFEVIALHPSSSSTILMSCLFRLIDLMKSWPRTTHSESAANRNCCFYHNFHNFFSNMRDFAAAKNVSLYFSMCSLDLISSQQALTNQQNVM